MTTERKRKPVQVHVASKSETDQGWEVSLDIPSFQSRYPTIVNRVDESVAARLVPGRDITVILEQQNLKRGKDGSKPYDYYYGIVNIADAEQAAVAQQETKAVAQSQDHTRDSIERQKALAEAVATMAAWTHTSVPAQVMSVLNTAEAYYRWLQGDNDGAIVAAKATGAWQPPAEAPEAEEGEESTDVPF